MHLVLESWSSLPSGKGSFRPPPCAYFSLTKIDEENAVMFGGHLSGIDYSANVYTLKLSDMVSLFKLRHVTNCIK